jgi:hypothetical protein
MVHPAAEGREAWLVREAQIVRPLLVFLTLCTVLTLGLWTATQYEATPVPVDIKGTPWVTVAGYAIDHLTRQARSGTIWIVYGTCVVAMFAAGLVMKIGAKKKTPAMAMAARSGVELMTRNGRD